VRRQRALRAARIARIRLRHPTYSA
jgi:hypothetical protein